MTGSNLQMQTEADTVEGQDASVFSRLHSSIGSVIRGKDDVIHDFLVAIIAGGSILLEDLPGVGKTTLAKSFASLVELKFDRLQCTPDLLPSDVYGFSVYNAQDGSLQFRPGPVFCNLLLVDEINRASPRTQSALLEAMAEKQVTIDGECRSLASPFLVIATQNPSGFQGTYPLPEAQLDRFLFNLAIEYPDHESEIQLLYDVQEKGHPEIQPVIDQAGLLAIQTAVAQIEVHRDLADYIVRIVATTRTHDRILTGCSPRGSQMLFRAAQAQAFACGRQSVLPDDIQHVAPLTLAHRIVIRQSERFLHRDKCEFVRDLVKTVSVPV